LGALAAVNIYVGEKKIEAAVAFGVTTAATGAIGAAGAAYGVASGSGQIAAGTAMAVGAINGKTEGAEEFADAVTASSTVSGLITLAVTRGNVAAAATMAGVEGVVTPAATRTLFKEAVDLLDAFSSAAGLITQGSQVSQPRSVE